MTGRRSPVLDDCQRRLGMHIEFYDPDGERFGLPTYPYRRAPEGLATIRQLRALGLRPGGQDIAAQILWRRGKRVAYLYDKENAKPKRTATPAQRRAVDAALRARRTCSTCGVEQTYYIPRHYGQCLDCEGFPPADHVPHPGDTVTWVA